MTEIKVSTSMLRQQSTSTLVTIPKGLVPVGWLLGDKLVVTSGNDMIMLTNLSKEERAS